MPHTVLRRRVLGEPVERIQSDLITRKGESPRREHLPCSLLGSASPTCYSSSLK
jgi:hypothetical protein